MNHCLWTRPNNSKKTQKWAPCPRLSLACGTAAKSAMATQAWPWHPTSAILGLKWTCLVVCAMLLGCSSKPTMIAVQGEVSFDGQSVERGQIDFVPIEKTPGGSAVGTIANGRYEIAAKNGLQPAGVYSVRIVALRKTGVKAPNRFDPQGPPAELEENYIPANYNSASTLKIRVADPKKVDFQLRNNR